MKIQLIYSTFRKYFPVIKPVLVSGRLDTLLSRRTMSQDVKESTENNVQVAETESSQSSKRPLDNSEEGNCELAKRACSSKKKKVAMLLSYCGDGYLGMQVNHGFKTIEGELFQAFLKVGIMDEESYKFPQTIHFQRAARTDKGVSATHQVISLKMRLQDDDIIQQINSFLPDCIVVHSLKRVTGGFNSKTACDGRSYAYIVPTFAFAPKEVVPSSSYRMNSERLAELNSVLSLFKGTRNFHNFTSGKLSQDPSSKRYVIQFSCGQPYLVRDMEFVKVTIKGQSFMLHQIRKMIGLTIALMRGFTTKETLEKAFKMDRVNVPMAPSLNLMLEEPHYDSYNRRYGTDGMHEPLKWDSFDKDIEKFCADFILPVLYDGEMQKNAHNGSMMNWLTNLPLHTYEFQQIPSIKPEILVDPKALD